jgi:hypothetical protein
MSIYGSPSAATSPDQPVWGPPQPAAPAWGAPPPVEPVWGAPPPVEPVWGAPSQPTAPPPTTPVSSRPPVLTTAAVIALAVAVLNIVSAVLILASVDDLVRNQIANNPPGNWDTFDPALVDMTSERAEGLQKIFSSLAGAMIFWALVLVTLAVFTLRGGRTTRILSAVILVFTVLFKSVDLALELPTAAVILDVLVGVLALVAVVLFFLPAANAYGRQRRAARSR